MDIFEKVRQLLVEQLDVDAELVTMEASITEDLGADSLDLVDLVMELENEFDTEIPDEDLSLIHIYCQYRVVSGIGECVVHHRPGDRDRRRHDDVKV